MGRDSPSLITRIVQSLIPPKSTTSGGQIHPCRGISVKFSARERVRLDKVARRTRDALLARRYRIVILRSLEYSYTQIMEAAGVARSTVSEVLERWSHYGDAGLVDRREENGPIKADEEFLAMLYKVLEKTALEWGWARPTWTREMLIETLEQETGVRVSLATMSRALQSIRARRGNPKPIGICPWSKAQKTRRLREIRKLIETLPADEVAFWADEVDVNLNPKIGLDWMLEGHQRQVPTPGTNVKRYIAGALHTRTRKMTWVWGEKRNSQLFIDLMLEICRTYGRYRIIHLIVDNARFHTPEGSKQTALALAALEGRIMVHYLPTYSPDDNPIERFWEDFHAEVTRNHHCSTIEVLMDNADSYLAFHNDTIRAKRVPA